MTARELLDRYPMQPHPENGMFLERHYVHTGADRPASGSIYYYVGSGERTRFHSLDCEEYWNFIAGEPLEIRMYDPRTRQTAVCRLGTEAGCEPTVYIPKGVVFAARQLGGEDGTFFSCITVPRYRDAGSVLYTDEEIREKFPQFAGFDR